MYNYCKYKHDQNPNMVIHQINKYEDIKKIFYPTKTIGLETTQTLQQYYSNYTEAF